MSSLEERIIAGCDDAVVHADRDGIIRLWNAGAERVLGYSAAEAVGKSLDLIIPEKQRRRHWEGYHRVMESGKTSYAGSMLAVPASARDGRRLSVEFSVVLVQDETGRVEGIAAIMRDVTERWTRERARQRELADLRGRVGADG
jgi:PAS domain S-box-containing protein